MADYIDRQEVLDAIQNVCKRTCTIARIMQKSINELPSAERHGRWIEFDDAYNRISGRCSVCGWESHLYEDDVVGMPYCPNCGTRMDGEQNETD